MDKLEWYNKLVYNVWDNYVIDHNTTLLIEPIVIYSFPSTEY